MMTTHPRARAARLSHSPKLAARDTGLTVNEVRAIRDLRDTRRAARQFTDPLLAAAVTRRYRTRSAIAEQTAADEARRAALAADIGREQQKQADAEAARATLLRAARIARALGFHVRASHMHGRVSSYYCRRGDQSLRISDHAIPSTVQRELVARLHGRESYDGYHGHELIIDRARSATWLRRAIILTAAGRSVP